MKKHRLSGIVDPAQMVMLATAGRSLRLDQKALIYPLFAGVTQAWTGVLAFLVCSGIDSVERFCATSLVQARDVIDRVIANLTPSNAHRSARNLVTGRPMATYP